MPDTTSSSNDTVVALARIEDAHTRHAQEAGKHQRQRWTFALVAVALGPLAVSLLTIQAVAFAQRGTMAIILIALELAAVTFALAIAFLPIGHAHGEWIRRRVRAEVLRREAFLFRARAGSYLTSAEADLGTQVEARLGTLDSDANDPVALLSMEDEGRIWRDVLEDARHTRALMTPIPDFSYCLTDYLERRIVGQRRWFLERGMSHWRQARFFEGGAKSILILALIFAAFHLGQLVAGPQPGQEALHQGLLIVAITLPAVGAALAGLHSIRGSVRLNRSYMYHAQTLGRLEQSLRTLQSQLKQSSLSQRDLEFQFRRIVLETEELLSGELRQWWLILYPEAPSGGA